MKEVATKLGHVGTTASIACLIHCVAFPFLVGILPAIGLSFLMTRGAEQIMIWSAIVFSAGTMCWGLRTHRKWWLLVLPVLGAGYYYLANQVHQHIVCMVLGGVCLAAGNVLNKRMCKQCHSCNHS
jgi:hypothetical protein